MKTFDEQVNDVLNEGWKDKTAAGAAGAILGLGAIAGINKMHEPQEVPKNYPKQNPRGSVEQIKNDDVDYAKNILARTIWAEGRGEEDLDTALRAIATSIYNRTQDKINSGKINNDPMAYAKISLTPYQYSAWNGWTIKNPTEYPDTKERGGSGWNEAKKIADEILSGTFKPLPELGTSTHYFAPDRLDKTPGWAQGKKIITIGKHRFIDGRMNFPSPKLPDKI